jgi:hypothetical protein
METERALARMRDDVHDLRGAESRDRALASSRRAAVELRSSIDAALEMAEVGSRGSPGARDPGAP